MISVIIPTYNRGSIIKKSIESVLNQSYVDIEVLIVDDGSTDDTEKVVANIKDSRVRYFRLEKNSGACVARNIGASLAKGEYIAFQDSDDEWDPRKLDMQLSFLRKGNFDFVFCGMTRIMLEDSNKRYYYPNVDLDDNKDYFLQLLYLNRVGTQTILCKKECFDLIKFDPNLKRYQDWDLALQAAKYFKIGYLRESLVVSCIQVDSISKSKEANKSAWKSLYDKYYNEIIKDKKIHSKYLFRLGNEQVMYDINEAKKRYQESIVTSFRITTLLFFLLSLLNLKNAIAKLLDYQKLRLFR